MEIKIRGVDSAAVNKIDELARKKKLSRNEYLKTMLEAFAGLEEFKTFEERYQKLLAANQLTIEANTKMLSDFLSIISKE